MVNNKTSKIAAQTEFKKRFGKNLKNGFPLNRTTTLAIGGPAKYFLTVENEEDLISAVRLAKKNKLPWYVIGEGSNVVVADRGFSGLVIQNKLQGFKRKGTRVMVGAGNNLLELIFRLNKLDLAGLEKMAGIPGSVGGAVYGSAGAYGQEIKDRVVKVKFYDAEQNKSRTLTKQQCSFEYRESIFKKHKEWIIAEITLQMKKDKAFKLSKISEEIIKLREEKYKPGLKCPGSFFKNIKLDELKPQNEAEKLLKKIDRDMIMFGKVPAGYLLEEVGARGMKRGSIRVADHHANLIYNTNGGTADDIVRLAKELKQLVEKRFGVKIEEEIQYLE